MIKLLNNDGELVFILEPGNITKLQLGEPLSINLHELGLKGQVKICWVPDVIRFAMDLANEKEKNKCITSARLDQMLKASLEWRPLDRVAN